MNMFLFHYKLKKLTIWGLHLKITVTLFIYNTLISIILNLDTKKISVRVYKKFLSLFL